MTRIRSVVCIGTGPSLTEEQVHRARAKYPLYGCNNAFKVAPDIELLYACNMAWWVHYWDEVKDLPCEKWTTSQEAAKRFGINWIAEKNERGLSESPNLIHHGHGSGYSLVSMAHRHGFNRIYLLGYDLKYAPDYDGRNHQVGSTPRHFFGEYPSSMRHWPKQSVHKGVHTELVDLYKSIKEQGLVELVNCTPGSALEDVLGYTPI